MILNNLDDIEEKYKVIYLDPPWEFKSWSKKGEEKSAQNHYSCMSFDDLKQLPISKIGCKNSIMFMWATSPLIPKQIEIMEYWGYSFKTFGFTWVKTNKVSPSYFIGLGYYTRSNPEYCLIGVKGSIGRPKNKSISSIISSPIRQHSRKPDHIHGLIESMYDGPYIELFARTDRNGWDVWGNEVGKFECPNSVFDIEK